jgi:hypothetical protein
VCQHRWVKSRPEITQVLDRQLGFFQGVGDGPPGLCGGGGLSRRLQGEDDVDQTLLGAVVKVSAKTSPLVEPGLHDPGA